VTLNATVKLTKLNSYKIFGNLLKITTQPQKV